MSDLADGPAAATDGERVLADGSAVATDGERVLADTMPYRIVRPYRVRFEESTANETMRTAVYLAWAADVAWQHSTALGFGRDWYTQRGLFWLVRAVRLDVLRPIETYASVFVGTRVYGYRRIAARRDCDVRDATGELRARMQVDWVMTNVRGVPTRVPEDMFALVTADAPTFELLKVSLPVTPRGAFERRVSIARRDLDPLDHVNNSVYVDYLEEALAAAGADELLVAAPRRYEVDFASSAGPGDVLVGRAWPHEGGWAYRLSRDDGTEIFRAKVARLREP